MFFVRFIEYLAPFTILLTAYLYNLLQKYSKETQLQILTTDLINFIKKPFFKIIIISALFAIIILPIINLNNAFANAYPINRYELTARWLKNNTPEHSIIFHVTWDSFPRLFFYNQHNYYLVGLNPTFMYLYDQNIFWLWRNITQKSIACTDPTDQIDIKDLTYSTCSSKQQTALAIASIIKTQFQSEYIWINDYPIYRDFKKFLEANPEYFKKMIETNDSAVFKIIK